MPPFNTDCRDNKDLKLCRPLCIATLCLSRCDGARSVQGAFPHYTSDRRASFSDPRQHQSTSMIYIQNKLLEGETWFQLSIRHCPGRDAYCNRCKCTMEHIICSFVPVEKYPPAPEGILSMEKHHIGIKFSTWILETTKDKQLKRKIASVDPVMLFFSNMLKKGMIQSIQLFPLVCFLDGPI